MVQYLLTPPDMTAEAGRHGLPLVHLAFSLRAEGRLWSPPLSRQCRGGLMLVGTAEAPAKGDPDRALRQILSQCRERHFLGVVLDAEGPPAPFLSRLINALDRELARMGRGFFLPLDYARFSRRAVLFFSSALSGGSLRHRLEQLARAYDPGRLTLALERTAEEFPLPAPEGHGVPLSQEALGELMAGLRPTVHFSEDLCAHYFTYLDRQSRPRLVLFDRADSLRQKRALAKAAGIERFFLLYPQAQELLEAPEETERP